MTPRKLYPWTALVILTTLNFLNYIDRSVLFAVQPLVQSEFHLTNAQVGYLTSAFLLFYMVAAPFVGPLADRYSRKLIIVLGAVFWSGLTLMTAVTHTYGELLLRHTLVGVGEATFVTIAPTFVADLFPENKRGRIFGIFYLAIPVGTAASRIDARITIPARVTWLWPMAITSWPTRVASSVPVVLVTGLRLLRALSPKAGTRRPAQRCHSVASSGCQSNDSGFPRRVSVSTGKMFLPRSNLPHARPR